MRTLLLLTWVCLLLPSAKAAEKVNQEVVKAVRAAISAAKREERKDLIAQLLERKDLDWASFKKGLQKGPYYRKPLVTAYGARHSGKHFNLHLTGADGKERGFSLYIPKSYDAKTPLPAIFYLHHGARLPHPGQGAERAGVAIFKFRDTCEKHGIIFIAPYTCQGAEWWTPEGVRLVKWTLKQVKRRYNIDEDRIGLLGPLDGGDAVWYLGQEMPGTWSVLMPMTGDPYEIAGLIRPLFLGTLDRMDILMGVPGLTRSTVGAKDQKTFLDGLQPMFKQGMRITTSVWPRSQGDFHYLADIKEQVAAFVLDRKRKPLAAEVDIETDHDDGLRALWLRNEGYDPKGDVAHNLPTTILRWTPPKRKEAEKKIGIGLEARPKWPLGLVVTRVTGATLDANIMQGDVLLEVDGTVVRKTADVKPLIAKHAWNEEVHLVLARETKEADLPAARKREARYRKLRAKIAELRAQGKPVPHDLSSLIEDNDGEDGGAGKSAGGDDGEVSIDIGDEKEPGKDKPEDEGAGPGAAKPKTVSFIFERWVELRRQPGTLVRADFGISRDPSHAYEGVKIGSVYPGSLADRSGFSAGDVIVQVGSEQVKNSFDLEDYFKDFKFEKEPAGERFVEFTVKRQNEKGEWGPARTVKAVWEPREGTRVDAKWNKQENTLNVLTRKCSGFTVYFTGDALAPGKTFHLFINGIPFGDLVDPGSALPYPPAGHAGGGIDMDRRYRMRRKHAVVEGWTPDYHLALDDYLERMDRKVIVAAKRTIDLKALAAGFAAARKRFEGHGGKRGERIQRAYEAWRAKG